MHPAKFQSPYTVIIEALPAHTTPIPTGSQLRITSIVSRNVLVPIVELHLVHLGAALSISERSYREGKPSQKFSLFVIHSRQLEQVF